MEHHQIVMKTVMFVYQYLQKLSFCKFPAV